jgi:predicted RecA/RadA family phage recombinase
MLSHKPRMIAASEDSGSMTSVVGKSLGIAANDMAAGEGCQVALYQERCRTLVKMSVQPG